MIELISFDEINELQKNELRSRCKIPDGKDPAFVILAGSEEGVDASTVPPVINYKDSRPALIHCREPVTLATRGDVHALDKDAVYFIPAARPAMMKRRVLYAAAA